MVPQRISKYIIILSTYFLFCLIFSGCQEDTAYYHYEPMTSKGWYKNDTLAYTLPSKLAGNTYQLEIGLRHTENYPYRDIWIEIRRPLSLQSSSDTLHLVLADTLGSWYGNGTASRLYQFISPTQNIHLQTADSLIQLVHIMRDTCLTGITDVGIRLSLPSSINTQKDKQ